MTRKATDEEYYTLVKGGIPVSIVAAALDTSRGHIYKCMKRHISKQGKTP